MPDYIVTKILKPDGQILNIKDTISGYITETEARELIPTNVSEFTNDAGYITTSDIPEGAAASTTIPAMDGSASVGTELAFARGDHVHPSDTSRVPTSRTINGKPLSSDISLAASDVGALPNTTSIPSKTSDLVNDSGFVTSGDIPTKVSELTNDSGFITAADIPEGASPSMTTPKMDGTAAVGTETAFARGDHVHPTDTSRAAATHSHGVLSSNGGVDSQSASATLATGDTFMVSANDMLAKGPSFDTTDTSKCLTHAGTWADPLSRLSITYDSTTQSLVFSIN